MWQTVLVGTIPMIIRGDLSTETMQSIVSSVMQVHQSTVIAVGKNGISSIVLDSSTVGSTNPNKRLCWHTGNHVGGYRCGSKVGLNYDTDYVREIYHVD